jgi:benzoyl-CoA reductase/2-hydroxyglutaryl-CoA dehydratase subunit BcrC/BadD/HgdB
MPIRYPRALLRAFDLLPVEVWGPPSQGFLGAAHLQPYVCSVVRNALSFLLSGGLEVVDYLLVPHACDSLQGLGSLLIDFVRPRQPVFPLYIPRARRDSDLEFLTAELRQLCHRLEQATGRSPGAEGLLECVLREEAADSLLASLHQRRSWLPMTQLEFYSLVRSREYLPAEVFSGLAQAALDAASSMPPARGVPIVLSGIVPEPMSLFAALENVGGWVAADDLACCGRRLYPAGSSPDALQRMAQSLLWAPPDPMHGAPIAQRLAHLRSLVETSASRGVFFYTVKFCEPELFDLPLLSGGLQEGGVRTLAMEVDLNDGLSGQALTRLEAFLETIT